MPTMLFTALRKYAQFEGRARRKEYWQFQLLSVLLGIGAGIIDAILGTDAVASGNGAIGSLVTLALLLPGLAVGVRRMHDLEKSGWYILLPLVGLAAALVLGAGWFALGGVSTATSGAFGIVGAVAAGLIALAGIGYFLYLTVSEGTRGPNRYGPDPKGPDTAALAETFR